MMDDLEAKLTELERLNIELLADNRRLRAERTNLIEMVASRLEQSGAFAQAGLIRVVFITEAGNL